MRRSQTTTDHAEAVSRRLATLSAELAAVRGDAPTTHTRVRAGAEDQRSGARGTPPPVVVPVPGRHASRRLADRLGPAHLAVVAVLVAAAVGFAAWSAVRDGADPVPVPEVASAPSALAEVSPPAGESELSPSASGGVGAEEAPGEAQPAGEVTVDVAGRVRRPGIAVLPPGSRVVDAVEAAGGARRGVDLTSLNLARPLVDGEQILVGVTPPPGVAGTLGAPGGASPAGALVNLNTADQTTLETLPGVGPVTATAILDWRTEHGGFTAVDELLEVDGIGEATLADLAPLVTI